MFTRTPGVYLGDVLALTSRTSLTLDALDLNRELLERALPPVEPELRRFPVKFDPELRRFPVKFDPVELRLSVLVLTPLKWVAFVLLELSLGYSRSGLF